MAKKIKYIIRETVISLLFVIGFIAVGLLVLFLRSIPCQAAELNGYESILASASEADFEAMENVIYHESAIADCDFVVNVAVAETILNRAMSGEWGKSIEAVCKAKGQFAYGSMPKNMNEHTAEDISDAIEYLVNGGKGFLPSKDYVYFATKKQSYAKDHVWIGATNNGKPKKGRGMYFGASK